MFTRLLAETGIKQRKVPPPWQASIWKDTLQVVNIPNQLQFDHGQKIA